MALRVTEPRLDLLAAYRRMLTIRRFEERVLELRLTDEIAGSVHLCGGQEAIPVGALAALEPEDRIIATYRGHGWALACEIPLVTLFAEILGRASGTNGGRGGSAYLSSPEHRFLGENSIVGAGLPIANGVALAAKLSSSGNVVLVSFGDGATSQGATHEGLVMAVSRMLPVVFVCENNDWSEMTPISAIAPLRDLAERAPGYGMPGETVDGTEPRSVADAIGAAAERARAGGGPTFVECKTVRLMAHYHADVEHYRDPGGGAQGSAPAPAAEPALRGSCRRAVARRTRAHRRGGRADGIGARARGASARRGNGEGARHDPVPPDGRSTHCHGLRHDDDGRGRAQRGTPP